MPLVSIRCDAVVVASRDADGADVGTCNWLAKATEDSPLEFQIVEKLFDFCVTRRFTAVFTGASQWPRLDIGKLNVTHNVYSFSTDIRTNVFCVIRKWNSHY